MNKSLLWSIILAIVVLIIILAIVLPKNSTGEAINNENREENNQFTGETKTFDIIAKNWEFDPSTIKVNKGNKVVLNIESIDIEHGIAIPEFNVNQKLVPGKKVAIEFIADKSGTFSFFCNVFCGAGHRE